MSQPPASRTPLTLFWRGSRRSPGVARVAADRAGAPGTAGAAGEAGDGARSRRRAPAASDARRHDSDLMAVSADARNHLVCRIRGVTRIDANTLHLHGLRVLCGFLKKCKGSGNVSPPGVVLLDVDRSQDLTTVHA